MVESLRLAQATPSAFVPKTNKIKQNVFFLKRKNAFALCYCRKGATTRVNSLYNGLLHANSSSREWVCAHSVCWLPLAALWMLLCFLANAHTESGIIPVLRSLMQEDHCKFKTLLGYRVPRQHSLRLSRTKTIQGILGIVCGKYL